MTAPSPTRTLDTDLALFWRALEGFLGDWQADVDAEDERRAREGARLREMHRRYATRRKARRVRRGR